MNDSLVKLPEVEDMTAEQLSVYEKFRSNLTKALLITKCSAGPHLALGGALTKGYLNDLEREVIVLRVAKLVNSEFERVIHYPLAIKAGLSEEEIDDIENGRYEKLSPRRAAMVKYITECIENTKASPSAFRSLNGFYSQGEIADATHLAGHCWMTAMYLASLAIPLDTQEASWDRLTELNK
ncbi:carboxymuconolactone decarboxylase family protein [Klebsiella pneumoniae subsp. pneumoniae]|uniref:carboxymuconolactone decarboxylase family protein n=1 Tax=Klebsiella pneumoniae TaxID=573 RepID=UPI0021B45628|nr:carboxymuconolactone decarboxylase family protein [Klebsiella pneumoniae]MCT6795048.1 carboxymuconolactone decarboxylase family protein [Klebsiella pneumoniae subsp. pneumoniae]